MQYTQAQIDRANAVSLEDFLRTQGETLIKSGREYRSCFRGCYYMGTLRGTAFCSQRRIF